MGLKERYVYTHRRRLGTFRELLVENALRLLGFQVERVGLGVAENGYVRGRFKSDGDAFDLRVSRLVGLRLCTIYLEVTGCTLTPESSRRRLRSLIGLDKPAVFIQKSKLEKYEALSPGYPVAIAHVWDPLLRIDWAWMEQIKHSILTELKLGGEPNPYLAVELEIWKPLSRLPEEIAHPPAFNLADWVPRRLNRPPTRP